MLLAERKQALSRLDLASSCSLTSAASAVEAARLVNAAVSIGVTVLVKDQVGPNGRCLYANAVAPT